MTSSVIRANSSRVHLLWFIVSRSVCNVLSLDVFGYRIHLSNSSAGYFSLYRRTFFRFVSFFKFLRMHQTHCLHRDVTRALESANGYVVVVKLCFGLGSAGNELSEKKMKNVTVSSSAACDFVVAQQRHPPLFGEAVQE